MGIPTICPKNVTFFGQRVPGVSFYETSGLYRQPRQNKKASRIRISFSPPSATTSGDDKPREVTSQNQFCERPCKLSNPDHTSAAEETRLRLAQETNFSRSRPCFSTVPELCPNPICWSRGTCDLSESRFPRLLSLLGFSEKRGNPWNRFRSLGRIGVVSTSRGPRGDWLAHTSCTQIPPTLLQAKENATSTRLIALIKRISSSVASSLQHSFSAVGINGQAYLSL